MLNKSRSTPFWYQLLECSGVFLFLTVGSFVLLSQGQAILSLSGLSALSLIAAAWIFADFTSGVIHWLADTYGSEETPLLGKGLIHPFREHHLLPRKMTTHNFIETNGSLLFGAAFFLLLSLFTSPQMTLFIMVWSFFTALTNQFHKWSHTPKHKASKAVKILQATHLIISLKKHLNHHSGNFKKSYCITSGVCNPLLDRIDFWRYLELFISKLSRFIKT